MGKGDLTQAETELNKLKMIVADDTLKEVTIWDVNTTQELMQIARHVLEGEIEAQKGNYDQAAALLNKAIEIES